MTDLPTWTRHVLTWDELHIRTCLVHAGKSKDPATQVGAVIVASDNSTVTTGFNGFPRKVLDLPSRLNDRDLKLKLIVHAEMNAVLAAAKRGVALDGCTLYLAATDETGFIWGGPPCVRCTVELIQAGIKAVRSPPRKTVTRWAADLDLALVLLQEAGITYTEIK